MTIRRNGFIGYALALGLQWDGWRCENLSSGSFYLCAKCISLFTNYTGLQGDGWRCENLSSHSFYLPAKCNSLFTNYTHHSKSPDLCGNWQSIARSVRLLSCYLQISLEIRSHSRQCFPRWNLAKQRLPVLFSHEQNSRQDPSYLSFPVLWWAPGLTITQRKLHPRFGAWFWIVIAVATRDAYSARHNTSLGFTLPTPSRSVDPHCTSSGFLCIDTFEMCVPLPHTQLEP